MIRNHFFFLMILRPPRSTLFPYTTLRRDEAGPSPLPARTSDPSETVAESRGRVGWLESVASCEDEVWRSFCEHRPPAQVRVGDRWFARRSSPRACFAQETHARLITGLTAHQESGAELSASILQAFLRT